MIQKRKINRINIALCLIFALPIILGSCEENKVETDLKIEGQKVSLMDSLNREIEREPMDQTLYLLRAQAHLNKSNFEEAEKDFDRCLRVDTTFDLLYQMRGDYLYDSQKYKESKEDYEACIEYNPKNKFCILKKAKMELLLGNLDIAIKDINSALRIDEFYADAYFEKGRYYELLQDTTLAVSSYSTAIEIDPNYYFAYIQIALMYSADQNDLALEYYNSALEIAPNSVEALLNKGLFLQDTGWKDSLRYDEAIRIYNMAEQIQPVNHIPNYNKGYVYMEYKSKLDSAAMEFRQVIAKDPYNYKAFYNLGLCLEKDGKLEDALKNMNKSLTIEPTFTLAALAKERLLNTPN